jgi:2-polyprenyl-3-methyl-5-hydroxy-6-metoxy-1,4-benzoquinol methylase
MDLANRANLPELMDADGVDVAVYNRCLSDLASVNRVTMTHFPTLRFLSKATRHLPPGSEFAILDVASGHGDLLRNISNWAKKRGFHVNLWGLDMNPRSSKAARDAMRPGQNISFITGDVFNFHPRTAIDFIVTSQFTHHLSDDGVITILKWLETTARRGWHIADLHRHVVPYYGFRVLARIFGWHPIVRYDGTISIARSFRRADWERYLAAGGLKAEIAWYPMFRYCVSRIK